METMNPTLTPARASDYVADLEEFALKGADDCFITRRELAEKAARLQAYFLELQEKARAAKLAA